jgi:hypothetical protein
VSNACFPISTSAGTSPFAKRFFEASPTLTNRADVFLLAAADWVTEQLIPDLIKAAIDFADAAAVARSDATLTQAAVDEFKRITPAFAENISFGDIINAAWKAYLEPDFWQEDMVPSERKFEIISELTFKSIEVLEYNTRMKAQNAP